MRLKAVQSVLVASVAWFGVGCGTIEFPMNLEVAPGSFIAIDQVFNGIPVPPPNNGASPPSRAAST